MCLCTLMREGCMPTAGVLSLLLICSRLSAHVILPSLSFPGLSRCYCCPLFSDCPGFTHLLTCSIKSFLPSPPYSPPPHTPTHRSSCTRTCAHKSTCAIIINREKQFSAQKPSKKCCPNLSFPIPTHRPLEAGASSRCERFPLFHYFGQFAQLLTQFPSCHRVTRLLAQFPSVHHSDQVPIKLPR
jgi:hypothetical protein